MIPLQQGADHARVGDLVLPLDHTRTRLLWTVASWRPLVGLLRVLEKVGDK